MSRKSAYVLKSRDAAFASAWRQAIEGDKVDEVEEPPVSRSQGDTAAPRTPFPPDFVELLAALRESAALAPQPPRQ